jgi:hypothetical protein
LRQHSAIPETQDTKAVRSKEGITIGVVGRVHDVLASIDLYDNRCFQAGEVANVPPYRMLPSEFEAVELSTPQATPEASLGFRGIVAKVASIVVHVPSQP